MGPVSPSLRGYLSGEIFGEGLDRALDGLFQITVDLAVVVGDVVQKVLMVVAQVVQKTLFWAGYTCSPLGRT